ncbi:MAG: hypothetical protein NTW19_00345 [Planctomycetota bacterium]|nr:hypothetical protein [Planctomycetota bacterium]
MARDVRRGLRRGLFATALWALTGVLAGCPPQGSDARFTRPAELPSYGTVVNGYNANAGRITRLWARAVAEMEWRQEGKRRFEQGDGILAVVTPDRSAFSLGKLGNPLFWAGTNAKQYWLLDLREERLAYVGERRNPPKPPAGNKLPVPIYPPDLLRVLGIGAIDKPPDILEFGAEITRKPDPPVGWENGLIIEPPGSATRYVLDPKTFLPARIELVDAQGEPRLIARLSRFEPVKIAGQPPGGLPKIATRVEITLPETDGRMTLFLSDPSDGQERIDDDAFDLEKVKKTFRPRRVVDLDAP